MQPSLYIHIPFCEVKCGYCDFYSVPRGWEEFDLQEAYVAALCREIGERAEGKSNVSVQSIFFGGGTPSLLRTDLLEKIFNKLREYFIWNDDTEITMECNPKTIDKAGLAERKALGINRVSMGVQSFQDRFLKTLGRIHSGKEARRTIESAQGVGFDKISFDLMFALPGQSFEDWQSDLETALFLGTAHLSCYNLTIESNTPFAKLYAAPWPSVASAKEGSLPSDDVALKQFLWTRERLDKAGLPAYEISNFASPENECIHNQNYWQYGEYIGFGVSAASFVKTAPYAIRCVNVRDLNRYIADNTPPEIDPIDKRTAMGEFVMLALRTREGVSEAKFESEFGEKFSTLFADTLDRLGTRCIAPTIDNHWHLTAEGLRVADSIIIEFL